jgi:branched-chain amino acid aminotransferase
MIVYLNGAFIPLENAVISPLDRGFLLGDGVFETIYVENGQPECVTAHEKMLRLSAQALYIPYPEDLNLDVLLRTLLEKNQLTAAAVRITVTRGIGERGLMPSQISQPTVLITAFPYQRLARHVTVITSTERFALNRLSWVKHLGYQQAILARLEAGSQGGDEALWVNSNDQLVSATCANVFVKLKKEWMTPPIQSGARPGVMRGRILATRQARVGRITMLHLQEQVEAMVLTNSLIGIQVVKSLDHKPLDLDQAEKFKQKFIK